jgi:hypothetical protein
MAYCFTCMFGSLLFALCAAALRRNGSLALDSFFSYAAFDSFASSLISKGRGCWGFQFLTARYFQLLGMQFMKIRCFIFLGVSMTSLINSGIHLWIFTPFHPFCFLTPLVVWNRKPVERLVPHGATVRCSRLARFRLSSIPSQDPTKLKIR